eukprot:TRINITY_DN1101_c0_g1_i1.p1 TRINITY_DN1101_c0_g1~~TRINITY_DN1101_c0_g1_i1.p1  ORF type:complete len:133 (-),score=19.57 TRINITY_DN1101_c0_g1_i1:20-418(-)
MYYVFGIDGKDVILYANILGYTSAGLTVAQWSPQIYTTYVFKGPGSLSLVTLLLQMPGAFLVVAFQIMSKKGISTWGPYLVGGIQQFILVLLIVYYMIRDYLNNNKSKYSLDKHILNDEEYENEVSPLLNIN